MSAFKSSQISFAVNIARMLLDLAPVEEDLTLSVRVSPILDFKRGDDGSPIFTLRSETVVYSATAIHLAAVEGDEDLISLLLPISKASCQSYATFTPLFLALYHEHRQAAKLFLRGIPDCDDPQLYGPNSVLHAAARHGYRHEITKFVKNYGINPDYEDIHGATPILYAFRLPSHKAFTTICLLLSLGADKNKRIRGWGYSDLARSMGYGRLADWFESMCDDCSTATLDFEDDVPGSP